MPEFASVSRNELTERRRKLRRQRRLKGLQTIWRSLAVTAMTGGLLWLITSPIWVIRQPNQIVVEGNEHLSVETVQSLLAIDYPQSLWSIQPQAIARQLEIHAPIVMATVTRHLFPPGLTVQIQERHPVAIAYREAGSLPQASAQAGLLDEEGIWIPMENYTALRESITLPALKVIGMRESYRSDWKQLYKIIRHSPIQISEIDWRNPANLILTTDLGIVHIGAYSARFSAQLSTLDQMRQLPSDVDINQIDYINLKNPDSPLIQMLQPITPNPSPSP